MNTPAIYQAIRLEKQPEEMAWLCFPDSDLPEGVTDLLRICSSKERLINFSEKNDLNPEELSLALLNFIEKVMLREKNSPEKILGTNKFSTAQTQDFHYNLLMKIYKTDSNKKPSVEKHSKLIKSAHQNLSNKEDEQEVISFSEYRKSASSYKQNTQKIESEISNIKTVLAVISAITISFLVAMSGQFFASDDSKLTANISNQETINTEALNVLPVVSTSKTSPVTTKPSIKVNNASLQNLLKKLEVAYEKGDVDTIKPILANAPEIQGQTEKQLNDKLETIFEITSERKMFLFDFDWTNSENALQGKGSFISRYQLVGEKEWLTRKGTALISAKVVDKKLEVTRLTLQNQAID